MFWVISVYFNIRNTFPKSGTFLLGHPVYSTDYWTQRGSLTWKLFLRLAARKHRNVAVLSWSLWKAVYKPVWHIPLLSVQWINSRWWADELSETCRVSCQNKFCEISASSWVYYKEMCLHDSMTTLNPPVIFSSHTVPIRVWYRPSTCLQYSFHTRPCCQLVVEGRVSLYTRCTGCRSSDLAAKSDLHVTSLSFNHQFSAEVLGTIISRSEASTWVILLKWL